MYIKLFTALPALVLIAGCAIDPTVYESTPIVVDTAAGPVTCQLYTKERVLWDRATARPNSMDVETADNICRQEGVRELPGNRGSAEVAVESAAPAL